MQIYAAYKRIYERLPNRLCAHMFYYCRCLLPLRTMCECADKDLRVYQGALKQLAFVIHSCSLCTDAHRRHICVTHTYAKPNNIRAHLRRNVGMCCYATFSTRNVAALFSNSGENVCMCVCVWKETHILPAQHLVLAVRVFKCSGAHAQLAHAARIC